MGRTLLTALAAVIAVIAVQGPVAAAPRCFSKRATIVGTGGHDRINGTPRRDVIVSLGGHDRINGRSGNDLICGGAGRDVIRGKGGDDQLSGGGKRDVLTGHSGDDRLAGSNGSDVLVGARGNDVLSGGPGNEHSFFGGPGMFGGPGDDVYDGGGGAFDFASLESAPTGVVVDLNVTGPQNTNEGVDVFLGVEGVVGTGFDDLLIGHDVPSETGNGLFGLGGADELLGRDGNDVLDGGLGSDRGGPGVALVNGGAGLDLVFGGPGDDDLYGESGSDVLDGFEEEETTGDFGSGGADPDQCFRIETFDPDPANACETTARKARAGSAVSDEAPLGGWMSVAVSLGRSPFD
jgi:Ca2+-binding RTX toxin-like protein